MPALFSSVFMATLSISDPGLGVGCSSTSARHASLPGLPTLSMKSGIAGAGRSWNEMNVGCPTVVRFVYTGNKYPASASLIISGTMPALAVRQTHCVYAYYGDVFNDAPGLCGSSGRWWAMIQLESSPALRIRVADKRADCADCWTPGTRATDRRRTEPTRES